MEENLSLPPTTDNWFPYTKLQAPQLTANHVTRPQLQAALVKAVGSHKLTLIAAPAGSGKTTLAATLTHTDLTTIWVALDSNDDDFSVFVSLLLHALRAYLADDGEMAFSFLQGVPNAAEKPALLATRIVNTLKPIAAAPIVVILDDYHVINDSSIHQLIDYLLDYLPDGLRLVIATRHDPPLPLPRLRARGLLAEFRLMHLQFAPDDVAVFFNQQYHLALSEAEVATLQTQTEGWAAGLQLLASVLKAIPENEERSGYIRQLTAKNRTIFELLAVEVLEKQPAALQTFLLHTAILPELTPENCAAVTENPHAAQLLQLAYRQNLFLSTLAHDAVDGPYRYHDLFRSFLQQRLKQTHPTLWAALHLRAAEVASSSEQKLQHLMRAEQWDAAAQQLLAMTQTDIQRRFTRRSVVGAIEALPEKVCQNYPWLQVFVGQYYAVRGMSEQALIWLEQAEAQFRANGDVAGEIEVLTARSVFDTGESLELVESFREKIETARHLIRPDQEAIYHGAEIWHAITQQDWATISTHMQANIRIALASTDPAVLMMVSLTIAQHFVFADEGIKWVESLALHVLKVTNSNDLTARYCAYGILGAVRFFQGRMADAEQAARNTEQLAQEVGGMAWIDDHAIWLTLAIHVARRAYHAFDATFAAQEPRRATQDTANSYRLAFLYLKGRSLWLRNQLRATEAVLAEMQTVEGPTTYDLEDQVRCLTLAGLIAMAKGDTGAAKRDLQQAVKHHRRVRHTIMLTHPQLTLATLYGRQNRWDEALAEFKQVWHELKARGLPGVVLQEGESIVPMLRYAIAQGVDPQHLTPLLQILDSDDSPQPIAVPGSAAYLTPREVEVLRLLATGATNPSIAAELSITERTVKAHVTRLLTKLQASTRTEAVTKATQFGLI